MPILENRNCIGQNENERKSFARAFRIFPRRRDRYYHAIIYDQRLRKILSNCQKKKKVFLYRRRVVGSFDECWWKPPCASRVLQMKRTIHQRNFTAVAHWRARARVCVRGLRGSRVDTYVTRRAWYIAYCYTHVCANPVRVSFTVSDLNLFIYRFAPARANTYPRPKSIENMTTAPAPRPRRGKEVREDFAKGQKITLHVVCVVPHGDLFSIVSAIHSTFSKSNDTKTNI